METKSKMHHARGRASSHKSIIWASEVVQTRHAIKRSSVVTFAPQRKQKLHLSLKSQPVTAKHPDAHTASSLDSARIMRNFPQSHSPLFSLPLRTRRRNNRYWMMGPPKLRGASHLRSTSTTCRCLWTVTLSNLSAAGGSGNCGTTRQRRSVWSKLHRKQT